MSATTARLSINTSSPERLHGKAKDETKALRWCAMVWCSYPHVFRKGNRMNHPQPMEDQPLPRVNHLRVWSERIANALHGKSIRFHKLVSFALIIAMISN